MVATRGAMPGLVAVNDGMNPVPLPGNPMAGVSLVHAKVVPATGLLKLITTVVAPLQ